MDRVDVARHPGVGAAEVLGQPPPGDRRPVRKCGWRVAARGVRGALPPAQVDAVALPDQLVAHPGLHPHVEGAAPPVRAQGARGHRQRERVRGIQPSVGRDPVAQVHHARQRHREVAAGHQRRLHREGEHPRVRLREGVVDGVAGEPLVRREPVAVDLHALDDEGAVGHRVTARELGRQGGPHEQRGGRRHPREGLDGHVRRRAGSGRRLARRCRSRSTARPRRSRRSSRPRRPAGRPATGCSAVARARGSRTGSGPSSRSR